jgi:hypothetical protein
MEAKAAEAIAQAHVTDIGRKLGIELTVLRDQTIEFGSGWVFFYDSLKYVEGGAVRDALAGNAPLIVSKRDGSVHVTGTAHPIEDYVREFERAHGLMSTSRD